MSPVTPKNAPSIAEVIGANTRRIRGEHRAEDLAKAARKVGLNWNTGRVSELEAGRVSPTIPTIIALLAALRTLTNRSVRLDELLQHDGPIQLNDKLRLPPAKLLDALSNNDFQLRARDLGVSADEVRANVAAGREELDLMARLEARYGDVDLDLIIQAESAAGLAEERMAKDLGVRTGTIAHAAVYLWHKTFSEERAQRAGPDANAQKLGQVTRRMKAELRAALDEVGDDGDDQ